MNQPMQANRIFCAFPIFCPSEKMFKKNLESVVSFVEYVNLNSHYLDGSKGFILDLYWGGWSAKQEWFDTIKAYIKNNLIENFDGNGNPITLVKIFQYDKNYGKAKIVNDLSYEYNLEKPQTQFLFTMDSDMVFLKDQVHFFDRLFLAARCIEEIHLKQTNVKKPFGFLALNQGNEANYHWFEPRDGYTGLNQKAEYELNGDNGMRMKEELVWSSDGCGIAGGGIFCNFLLWKHIGGYRKMNAEYASDDGLLLRDCIQNGASACVIKSLHLKHPIPEDDPLYEQWKKDCMKIALNNYDAKLYEKNLNSQKDWVEK